MQPQIRLIKWSPGDNLVIHFTNGTSLMRSMDTLMAARQLTREDLRCRPPELDGNEPGCVHLGRTIWSIYQLEQAPALADAIKQRQRGRSNQIVLHWTGAENPPSTGMTVDALRRASEARERLLGHGGAYTVDDLRPATQRVREGVREDMPKHPDECHCGRCAAMRVSAAVDRVVKRHVEGCACATCSKTRDGMHWQPIVERTLSCPVCRRDYGRVRVEACATVEVICHGCEAEGRADGR